jgi:hypothetical protein
MACFLLIPIATCWKVVENLLDSVNPDLSAIASRMVNHQTDIELVEIDQSVEYIAYAPLKQCRLVDRSGDSPA